MRDNVLRFYGATAFADMRKYATALYIVGTLASIIIDNKNYYYTLTSGLVASDNSPVVVVPLDNATSGKYWLITSTDDLGATVPSTTPVTYTTTTSSTTTTTTVPTTTTSTTTTASTTHQTWPNDMGTTTHKTWPPDTTTTMAFGTTF